MLEQQFFVLSDFNKKEKPSVNHIVKFEEVFFISSRSRMRGGSVLGQVLGLNHSAATAK